MRLVPLALLPLLAVACGDDARVRQPSAQERARIGAGIQDLWEYESDVPSYVARRVGVRRSRLRPHVASVRVSRSDPRLASAAVELRDARGRRRPGAAVVVLRRIDDPDYAENPPEWWLVAGPAPRFSLACTAATPRAIRHLLCPDPWTVVGYSPPRAPREPRFAQPIPSNGLRAIDWRSATLPGSACGATGPIRLRAGQAFVRSSAWPWWSVVEVDLRPAAYGDLDGDGRDEAAVGVVCSNGGGTASGQLGFATVVFRARDRELRVVGVVRPRQPLDPEAGHVPLLGRVEIRRRRVVAEELWYGPRDGTCCPSGRATTIWTYARGSLPASRTIVVVRPSR